MAETDPTDMNAPPDDAASDAAEHDAGDDASSASGGTTTSSSSAAEASRGDGEVEHPAMGGTDNDGSATADNDIRDGVDDVDDDIVTEGEEPSSTSDGQGEEERVVILPSLSDDPIILPAKTKPIKANAAEGDNREKISTAESEEQTADDGSESPEASRSNESNEQNLNGQELNAEEGEGNEEEASYTSAEDVNSGGDKAHETVNTSAAAGDSTESTGGTNESIPTEPSPDLNSSSGEEIEGSDDSIAKDNIPADGNQTAGDDKAKDDDDGPKQIKLVDYASKLAGAQVLEQSPSLKGASNLLTGDRDRYSIAPCEDKKYVVVGLSEDILVKQIKLSNYERYSSRVREFQVLASQEYPTPDEGYWSVIGTYEAKSKSGEQSFDLEEPAWARYLKFRFLSHYGSEHYCTLSEIKVHGSTMLQGFHEQWVETEKKDKELEQELQQDGEEAEADDPLVEEGEGVEDDNAASGEEEGQAESQAMADDAIPDDAKRSESIEQESDDNGESSFEEDKRIDESPETPAVEEEDAIENEAEMPTQKEAEGEVGASPEADESQQDDVAIESKEMSQNDKDEEAATEEKPEEDADSPSDADDKLADQNLPTETGGAGAGNEELEETVGEPSGEVEEQETKSSVSDEFDAIERIQPEIEEPIVTTDDRELPRNDSSISAVTDVVKAAVADASGVLKNATSGALNALHRTVASTPGGEADKEENGILAEETVAGDEPEGKEATLSKQDVTSVKATAGGNETMSLPRDNADDSSTSQDAAKPKVEEAASKVNNANASVATTKSKPVKEKSQSKGDTKSATSPGRDLLHRGTITLAGKDGKDITDVSASELYAKLSRRFPHAQCLKDLDFQAFKSKTLLANAGGPVGGGGAKMEPIFAKITHEIKSVQITQNQYEQYISALKTCYETVFWDVAKDFDSMQAGVDQRLASLERAVFLSEMRSGGRKSQTYERVTNLFASFPRSVSAFQFTSKPEDSKVLGAGLAILFLVYWCLPRKRSAARSNSIAAAPEPSHVTSHLRNGSSHHSSPQTEIPHLESEEDLREKERLAEELAYKERKLGSLQNEHTALQKEHALLQERFSQLEQTVTTLRMEQNVGPRMGMSHVILRGDGSPSTATPTPSVQSEPVSSELCTPPKLGSQSVSYRRSTMGESPLKKFRLKKASRNQ